VGKDELGKDDLPNSASKPSGGMKAAFTTESGVQRLDFPWEICVETRLGASSESFPADRQSNG
jgi:hypothetical protein